MKPEINSQFILRNSLAKCKKAFFFALLFSFFISIFTLMISIYSLQVLDRVLTSASIETLIFLTVITIFCLIFLSILTSVRSVVFLHISNWLDNEISPILLNNAIENSAQNKNQIMQNFRDLNQIKSFISSSNLAILFDAPFALIYLIVIFFIHPINGIITVIGALILFKLALINEKITHKLIEKSNILQNEVAKEFAIISSNSEVVKAMGMSLNVSSRWKKYNDKFQQVSSKLAVKSANMSSIAKAVRMSLQIILMASSAILVLFNKMSAGGIIATSILSSKALSPFDNAVSLWKSFITANNSYKKLNQDLKSNDENQEKIKLPNLKGEILVEKLIYKFPNLEEILLKSISFNIKQGESLAIIGLSGSGKTTLAQILTGVLKPTSGIVRIDGANLSDQNFNDIGKFIGYLPQNIELFKGSVKENIARMSNLQNDEEVVKTAKFCEIHDMILKLPKGYETFIEENGKNLSAGQGQRIGIARAFFGDVKFVVLDEPNSNLDSQAEISLTNTIKKAKEKNITLIIITHKPSIANYCDKIMILQDGQISAFDDSQKIIKNFSN